MNSAQVSGDWKLLPPEIVGGQNYLEYVSGLNPAQSVNIVHITSQDDMDWITHTFLISPLVQ